MAEKFNYAEANSDARELIAEFGQTMKLSKPGATGEQSFTGVLLDLKFKDRENMLAVGAEAKVLTADALKRDPSDDGDRVTINGVKYVIVFTETLRPAGIDVLHTLYVRK